MDELDLRTIFKLLWNKKLYIFLITALFTIAGIVYAIQFKVPLYSSNATLLLGRLNQTGTNEAITQTELSLNAKLVSTYSELVKSKKVLNEAISRLESENTVEGLSESSLRNNVEVNQVKETEILQIVVKDKNPGYAAAITNKITEVFIEEVQNWYKLENVNIVDPAESSQYPYNINKVRDVLMFAGIGLILSCILFLVLGIFDNTVKEPEDLERITDLLIIGAIPSWSKSSNTGKGGR